MQAEINNVLKVQHSIIELSGITALFGRNQAGKTSHIDGIAACLVGQKLPPGERNARVHSGGSKSFVKLTDGASWRSMDYPSGKTAELDWKLRATAESVGLVKFEALKETDLAKVIQDAMKTEVTGAEFIKTMKPYGFEEDELKKVWAHIEGKGTAGWTTAHESYKDTGAKMWARWEYITGKSFEPARGGNWQPDGWESDLEHTSEEHLSKVLTDEQDQLELLIKAEGISQDKYDLLKEEFLGLESLKEELSAAEAEKATEKKHLEALQEQFRALPTPIPVKEYPQKTCAYCSEANVMLPDGKLVKRDAVPTPDKGELEAQAQAQKDKRDEIATKRLELEGIDSRIMRLKLNISSAERAGADVAAAIVTTKDAPEQIEKQRQRVERAKIRLNAYKRKTEADRIFASFKRNEHLVTALSDKGLRKKKAAEALNTFNDEYLANVCDLADWPPVKVHPDMTITYDGRDITYLKGSALFRCQVALQVAVSYAQRAEILIIDAADILDGEGRSQFLEMLGAFSWVTLMSCTKDSVDDCPSFREAGIGISYWLEENTSKEIGGGDVDETAQERESTGAAAAAKG